MKLSTFALRHKTFVIFFTIICMIAGIFSYFSLGKLEDPTFTVKSAVIVTLYPGATANEVEDLVTDKVEQKLQTMGAVWKLRSLSRPGMSMIYVDLQEKYSSTQLPQQWDLLRRKVNDVKLELPPEAQISIVEDEFSEVYGMLFSVYGDDIPMHALKDYTKELQRRIKAVSGVKKVQIHGAQQQVININVSDERLAESHISMVELFTQLNAQNIPVTSGDFDLGYENLRVQQTGTYDNINDIKNLMIQTGLNGIGDGVGTVRLGDIADISMGYQDPATTLTRYNGHKAITLAVSPEDGINVVSIGDELMGVINQFRSELPVGADVGVVAYQPDEVVHSINNFIVNLLESILIVVAVLLIFMGARSALIVGFSLLLTILFTLVYMYITGVDLQRVSLGAFILALGMLVDNAIVIVDLFTVKLAKGKSRDEAVIESIQEMALPLLGATVIAALGTTPVLFSTTDAAEFAISVVQVLCSSLLLSWVVAMLVTPLMCWSFIKSPNLDEPKKENKFLTKYRQAVHWTVDNPKKTIGFLVPILIITAACMPLLKLNFIPTSDRNIVFLDYWLPNGGRIDKVSEDMKKIETWLLKQPEVKNISSYVGESAPRFSVTVEPEPLDSSYGQILINTKEFAGIEPLVKRGDKWIAKEFPYAEPRFRNLKLATKDKFNVEARFAGPDPKVLHKLSDQAQAIMRENPNTKYVRDNWRQESKLLVPVINQEEARRAGVNRSDISMAIHRATEGLQIGTMRQDDNLIPIKLNSEEQGLEHLNNIPVRSLLGMHSVPLGQVVDEFKLKGEETMIWRYNRQPAITAQAGVVYGVTPSQVRDQIKDQIEAIKLPAGYTMKWQGEYYDENRAVNDILTQNPKAMILMIILLMALFNAYRPPLIIITTVPLAIVGVVWGLLVFNKPFGFMALVGVITLSGMIIKNGIVLMDQIALERSNGSSIPEAVKEATLNRTMAISMAALTTALGMIPLLTDLLFDQMAASIIGGLTVASILSLFIMPALYMLLYRKEQKAEEKERRIDKTNQPNLIANKEVKGASHE